MSTFLALEEILQLLNYIILAARKRHYLMLVTNHASNHSTGSLRCPGILGHRNIDVARLPVQALPKNFCPAEARKIRIRYPGYAVTQRIPRPYAKSTGAGPLVTSLDGSRDRFEQGLERY